MSITLKKIFLYTCFIFISFYSNAKIIDDYGMRLGIGLSNQLWSINHNNNSSSYWKEDKVGFAMFFVGEKKLNKYIGIRPEIGYIQKGFKDNAQIKFADKLSSSSINALNNNLILHNLAVNVGVKILPFYNEYKFYFITGLRGEYLLGYSDIYFDFGDKKYGFYKMFLDDYNKYVLSGVLGVGFDYKGIWYVDIDYNPAITKNLNYPAMDITNRYFGLTIGMSIKNILSK